MWGRRHRRQSAEEYAQDRLRQLGDLGGDITAPLIHEIAPGEFVVQASVRNLGARGHGELGVYEVVECDDDGVPRRKKYSYQAMYGKRRLFRYDRDPTNHPEMPEHKHVGADERRVPSGRVTLQEVMNELWREIGLLER